MNSTAHAARLGISRGMLEFRQTLTSVEDISYSVVVGIIYVVVLVLQRGGTVDGTTVSLAALSLPGILGMQVALSTFVGSASVLAVEREDGTLLRSKAIPQGMVGYLTARVLWISSGALISLAIVLAPGFFLIEELREIGTGGWLRLVGVLVLGLVATLPWGAVVGSLFVNPQAVWGLSMLGVGSIVAISGIFYPIQALWGSLQGIAQVFPIYWLGLGMRSALLPNAAAAVEIGGSWRTMQMVAVLGAWAIAGLLIAPRILRRMARRESGASVEARRQKALQRI